MDSFNIKAKEIILKKLVLDKTGNVSSGNHNVVQPLPEIESIDVSTDEYDQEIETSSVAETVAYNETKIQEQTSNVDLGVVGGLACSGAIVATSVCSGVLDVAESILDFECWFGGLVVSIFDEDAAKEIRNFAARDLVSEANKAFYEGTDIGKAINENSYLKYDSEAAQTIRSVSKEVEKFGIEAALTITTGGLAAGLFGAVSAIGDAAESTYQQTNGKTSLLNEGGIVLSGGLGFLAGWGAGKLGTSFINIGDSMAKFGVKNVLSDMTKTVFSKNGITSLLKSSLASKSAISNYLVSGAMSADTLIPYFTGEKEFGIETAVDFGVSFGKNLALNVISDGFETGINNYANYRSLAINYPNSYIGNLVKEMPANLNDLEKSKYAYNVLTKDVSYPGEVLFMDSATKHNLPSKYNNIFDESIDTDLICREWSQTYNDILQSMGINSQVKGPSNGHQWVSFEADGGFYIADATNGYLDFNDLVASKMGLPTTGFIEVNEAWALSNEACTLPENKKSLIYFIDESRDVIANIDKKIGFDLTEPNELFSLEQSRINEILNLNSNLTTSDIAAFKLEQSINTTINNNLNYAETIGYLRGITNPDSAMNFFTQAEKYSIQFFKVDHNYTFEILLDSTKYVDYSLSPNSNWIKEVKKIGE